MFQGCKVVYVRTLKLHSGIQSRCMSVLSKAEAKDRRNALFEAEKKKQREAVGRIEKIEVKYQSPIEEVLLVMNRGISTPYDCARHMSEGVAKTSALAIVDGVPWDMHRPFTSNCELQLISLHSPKVGAVNTAFWRTCSFLLGAVLDTAFKPDIEMHLHSFPVPILKSGSFVHDIYLDLPDWKPTDAEMRAISAAFITLSTKALPIERIQTKVDVALEMFQENPFKTKQIPDIGKNNDGMITVYRVGDHMDISKGPMIGNTSLIGRCTIAAVHKLQSEMEETEVENLYRFQGVALPKGNLLNHFAYGILEERAKKLNKAQWMPQTIADDDHDAMQASAKN